MAKNRTILQIERDNRWIERWEKARAFGRWRFIWMIGVVGWGVPTGTLVLAWRWWSDGMPPTLRTIVIMAIVVAIGGGLTFGAVMWRRAERRYQRWLASHPASITRVFE
jgi:hypothetical protein